MKKFTFRLQRVIEVRHTREKECQRRLADSMQALRKCEEQLEKEKRETRESREGLRKALKKPVSVAQLMALDGWYRWKNRQVQERSALTDEQRGIVDQKRQELIEAAKDKKILERLKEKRYEEYRVNSLREEQAVLDDLGTRTGRMIVRSAKDGDDRRDETE
jgi:flagellar FliJ protein